MAEQAFRFLATNPDDKQSIPGKMPLLQNGRPKRLFVPIEVAVTEQDKTHATLRKSRTADR